ncbi:MAG: ribulose-phosphate 3-epimerase [Rickettsiales bacterium]|jgi:ribulose-phosphate 3-epimerase|nr:ribulose-phosphate 3-epimerase [Rickettsiales bacterium]
MNYTGEYLLALYIGNRKIRAACENTAGGRIIMERDARDNPKAALDSLLDALEEKTGTRFKQAHIAGFFGGNNSMLMAGETDFGRTRKISEADIRGLISKLPGLKNPELQAIHFVPVSYDTDRARNIENPVGEPARLLHAKFFGVLAARTHLARLASHVRGSYIEPRGAIDILFAMNALAGKSLLINIGASATRFSISTGNGIIYMAEIGAGQAELTRALSDRFGISLENAEKIKRRISSAVMKPGDQFETIGPASIADYKSLVFDFTQDLARAVKRNIEAAGAHIPDKVILFGGGAAIEGAGNIFGEALGRDAKTLGKDAAMQSVMRLILMRSRPKTQRKNPMTAFIRKLLLGITARKCPIYPSSLAFGDMGTDTLRAFTAAGITTIHYDFMDGEFVPARAGGAAEVRHITSKSELKVSAHLMACDPAGEIGGFIRGGAESIILSIGSKNIGRNLAAIKQAGRKCGIAVSPEHDLALIRPVIKHLDKIVVMSVAPGAGGQEFMPGSLDTIRRLKAVKRKARLKYEIIVDGGINPDTAKLCWDAGADALVSGSYLAHAPDLKAAVLSLLPNAKK